MPAAVANSRSAEKTFSRAEELLVRYRDVRDFSKLLTRDLEPEDCVVQSMPDVSPTKWHLAHTSWFFETFVLKKFLSGYVSAVPEYAFLFNSYYNAAGSMHRRDLRGLISRPTVAESFRYRDGIDRHISDLVSSASDELLEEIEPLLTLGLHHEQQHQELLLTDIKHVLAQNPLHPVYRKREEEGTHPPGPMRFSDFEEAIAMIGHAGSGFSYDNEGPRHRALVPAFSLATRLVTNGEYMKFIEDDGYRRAEFWLSLGWMTVNEQRWEAPLYWEKNEGEWWHFTLSGFRRIDPNEPVTHVSYFEADAFANWSGARLPTEFEWERVAQGKPMEGNFVESERFHPAVIPSEAEGSGGEISKLTSTGSLGFARDDELRQLFGDVWEWTRSSYSPYPGYRAEPGALGEYNGKFMCNQYVLRGGSCATSRSHIRVTYRNFFQPEKRWQFTGIRLARDAA
ncbi:MAG: ergothioneine biosynthesis protein EgtB [Chthoniobacterales bacterium]|nr:MAG: ergothioneine biosynthesis protein EgtB [Chthoniobacterales bacterium]